VSEVSPGHLKFKFQRLLKKFFYWPPPDQLYSPPSKDTLILAILKLIKTSLCKDSKVTGPVLFRQWCTAYLILASIALVKALMCQQKGPNLGIKMLYIEETIATLFQSYIFAGLGASSPHAIVHTTVNKEQ
jgi:hypothetical protein